VLDIDRRVELVEAQLKSLALPSEVIRNIGHNRSDLAV
jgi:hypothetical protein